MSKQFVLATVRANGTRWNVSLSDTKETETFVGKQGAIDFLQVRVASRVPVQALIYRAGSGDQLEEAWFFEPSCRRKLNVLTLTDETKRGSW